MKDLLDEIDLLHSRFKYGTVPGDYDWRGFVSKLHWHLDTFNVLRIPRKVVVEDVEGDDGFLQRRVTAEWQMVDDGSATELIRLLHGLDDD